MQVIQKRSAFLVVAALSGIGLGTVVYLGVRKKKRDRLASALLREVTRMLKPATAGLMAEDAFDVHLKATVLKKVSGKIKVLKAEYAKKFAKEVHGAWGIFNDDENVIYAVFRRLKDKVQVSQLAEAYQSMYKENLIDVFNDKLSKSEVQKILTITSNLPVYRKA